MSRETNEYNLGQIKRVWSNLETMYSLSKYGSKVSFLKAALGYNGMSSGLPSLCTRLKKYTEDCPEEYEVLFHKFELADRAIKEGSDLENMVMDVDLDPDSYSPALNYGQSVIEVDASTIQCDTNTVADTLKAGYLVDTFAVCGDSVHHLSIPSVEDYFVMEDEAHFKYVLSELLQKVRDNKALSKFEASVVFVLMSLILKKQKIDIPLIFAGSDYFEKKDEGICIGSLSTGKYKIKESSAAVQSFNYQGRVFEIENFCVYRSYVKDAVGNRFTVYFVEDV